MGVFVEELPYLGKSLFDKTRRRGKMFQLRGKMETAGKCRLRSEREYGTMKILTGRYAKMDRSTMWRITNDMREERL